MLTCWCVCFFYFIVVFLLYYIVDSLRAVTRVPARLPQKTYMRIPQGVLTGRGRVGYMASMEENQTPIEHLAGEEKSHIGSGETVRAKESHTPPKKQNSIPLEEKYEAEKQDDTSNTTHETVAEKTAAKQSDKMVMLRKLLRTIHHHLRRLRRKFPRAKSQKTHQPPNPLLLLSRR